MNNRMFLSPPHIGEAELEYIREVFESNYIAPLGEYVDRFEESVMAYTGANYALALNSGTSAIHLALRVLGVTSHDCVLASSMTFIGSVSPILFEKAQPIFIDSEKESWNLDPTLLEEAIKKAPKIPKALILTHLYGQSSQLDAILDICDDYGIVLIEDSAESLGATYQGRQTGRWGRMGIYSFNGNKIITTSGGGMLVSDDESLIAHARKLSTQAREPTVHYEHVEIGYNYRLSNVLAAIGVGQMEVLRTRIEKKRQIFRWYTEALAHIEEIRMMPELPESQGNRWLSCITFEKSDPHTIQQALGAHQFESRPLWKPMHLQPVFQHSCCVDRGVSQRLFERGVCLPSGTRMTQQHVDQIASIITKNRA
jgi:UDP-N-acetylbacillosamine transaminase